MYRKFMKRCLSLILSFVALLAVGWLIGLVALILHFANNGAGVFFLQPRPGKDAKIFKVIKFKTMTDERDADGKLLPDAQRLTRVGKIVRSLSLDELPQLVNILKGDMAFIGPRPWRVEYLPLYSPQQMRRHEVRPGITGWAQVLGRNDISFTKRLEYDIYYVDHLSFWLDARIFFMTIRKVLRREGISEAGQATSEAFNGHN